ncbi:hypothetical protein BC937DRAFT_92160 [Endogone sp. FLAS-F59071]|nr:hypothetical protein BC937DRAFT_92160 [Endogone sp. FLAS-F59071]|eukprot:RUS21585.1 hypothetical protein BC937DRAFT_92160 [Endogone sp. FLAS-F59071]
MECKLEVLAKRILPCLLRHGYHRGSLAAEIAETPHKDRVDHPLEWGRELLNYNINPAPTVRVATVVHEHRSVADFGRAELARLEDLLLEVLP